MSEKDDDDQPDYSPDHKPHRGNRHHGLSMGNCAAAIASSRVSSIYYWLLAFGLVANACGHARPRAGGCDGVRAFGPDDSLNKAGMARRDVNLLVRVSARGPTVRVHLEPDPTAKFSPDVDTHVGWIRVFLCTSGALVQSLEATSRGGPEAFLRFFEVKDVNFDGYLDLAVQRGFGATWQRQTWWVFDPQSQQFVSNDLTRALGDITANGLVLDATQHNITAGHLRTVCETKDVYHVDGGRRLVLVHQETPDVESDGTCTVTIRDWANGQLHVTTARRVP